MQHHQEPAAAERARFNPHPTRRSGATTDDEAGVHYPKVFQSSPDPEVGCNGCPGEPSDKEGSFNPHPTRRSGATAPG